MDKHEYKWAADLPFMEVRRFIAERLRQEPPSSDLDKQVCEFLDVAIVPCTQNLDAAISIIPDWWWHLSHLEAKVTPTVAVKGAPISNGSLYDWYGRPVGFRAMCMDRSQLPAALCEALLKARYDLPDAFVVEASASAHNDSNSRMQKYRHEAQHPPKNTLWRRISVAVDVLLDRD